MSEAKRFFNELKSIYSANAWHGPALKEVLEGVKASEAKSKPIGNAHSIWEIVLHIRGWNNVFLSALEGKYLDSPEGGDFPEIVDTSEGAWKKVLSELDEDYEKLLIVISGLTEEALDKKIADKDYNVRLWLRGTVNHNLYHIGQIALLKKAVAK